MCVCVCVCVGMNAHAVCVLACMQFFYLCVEVAYVGSGWQCRKSKLAN